MTDPASNPQAPTPQAPTQQAAEQLTFEQAHAELERIVEQLERGEAGLDEALDLWQRGEELYRFCRERLDTAQGKIEELARRVENAAESG